MDFHSVPFDHKFLLSILFCFFLLGIFLSGCTTTDEQEGFVLTSWSTLGYRINEINLTLEFNTTWPSGQLDLYTPSGRLLDSLNFSKDTHQVIFLINQTKYGRPEIGTYYVNAIEIIAGENHSVVKKEIPLNNVNLSIITCIPYWEFNATLDLYVFKSVNFTIVNQGDFFGFVYEGRIIVDNRSIFLAPDYHWHDLNLWIAPGENVSLDLPVEVPVRLQENHSVKIFLQDAKLVTIAFYESSISLSVE